MKIDVLLGLQWGDEGKGKVVDVLAPRYDIIARFQGGPNAGHTLIFNNKKYVLHLIPSGIFRPETINVIGNGVVLDPVIFSKEMEQINKTGIYLEERLYISEKTHLILPTHRTIDMASEKLKGKTKIGSTLKGIGPAYADKISRNGLRVGDINKPYFEKKYLELKKLHLKQLELFDLDFDIEKYEKEWFNGIETLKRFKFINSEKFFNDAMIEGKKILAEGAQGTLLDINSGTYPFVTSSTTTSAGVCTGLGVAPNKIGEIFGIFKAYTTRVGNGPFPTELINETGVKLRKIGHEFGATTGRERRCGWLDLTALKYAVQINGVTQLVMTKADVLCGFKNFKVATAYNINGNILDYMPYDIENEVKPEYKKFKAWNGTLDNITESKKFPIELKEYIKFIEKEVNVPITIISTGPDRTHIVMNNE